MCICRGSWSSSHIHPSTATTTHPPFNPTVLRWLELVGHALAKEPHTHPPPPPPMHTHNHNQSISYHQPIPHAPQQKRQSCGGWSWWATPSPRTCPRARSPKTPTPASAGRGGRHVLGVYIYINVHCDSCIQTTPKQITRSSDDDNGSHTYAYTHPPRYSPKNGRSRSGRCASPCASSSAMASPATPTRTTPNPRPLRRWVGLDVHLYAYLLGVGVVST